MLLSSMYVRRSYVGFFFFWCYVVFLSEDLSFGVVLDALMTLIFFSLFDCLYGYGVFLVTIMYPPFLYTVIYLLGWVTNIPGNV